MPLKLDGVQKTFDGRMVVDIAELSLVPGEVLALLGPSGCGKSTTLRLIAGLESAEQGTITIAGRVVANNRILMPPQRRKVGLVFQDYALFPHLNVADNVGYGLKRNAQRRDRITEMLALVGLEGSSRKYPRELSGGQQQRVALARALAPQPDLLLLDEPFSSLDPGLRQQVRADVRSILKTAGATALLVTHDQEEALSMADRVAVMLDGKIAQVDAPERLYYAPATQAIAVFIGEANLLEGTATATGITTPLGTITRPTGQRGPVQVMLRPELIDLATSPTATGVEGKVLDVAFYGHDYVAKVQIADLPEPVLVRLVRFVIVRPGQTVWLTLTSAGMVYPTDYVPHT